MLLAPHTMVGLAIGATIQNPFIAVPLSFAMHFAGDLIPHWDFFDHFPNKEELFKGWQGKLFITDLSLGIALGLGFTFYALTNQNPYLAMNMFLCGIAAVTPDAMYAPIVFVNSKNKIIRFFYNFQVKAHSHAGAIYGNITQIAVLILAFLMTANLLRQ